MPTRSKARQSENPTPAGRAADSPPAHNSERAPGQTGYGSVVDRRSGIDRRLIAEALEKARRQHESEDADGAPSPAAEESTTGLERRRGPGRRLSDFTRSAEEGELTSEQFLFVMAIEAFKRSNDRMFPTWCDVLEVVRLLGYRKTMPSELNLRNAEDWRESPLTPANVRAPRWLEHAKVDKVRAQPSRQETDRRVA